MPVTVNATPGAADANSYCTLAEATTYQESVPSTLATVWTAVTVTDDIRNRALVTATRLLDELIEWDPNGNGWVTYSVQVLMWPRTGMMTRTGYWLATDVIPQFLKNATAEFARWLIADASARIADSAVETFGLKGLKAGPIELDFTEYYASRKTIPDAVAQMVWPWGVVRGQSISVELERC